jgi:hypothetical protein
MAGYMGGAASNAASYGGGSSILDFLRKISGAGSGLTMFADAC